MTPEKPETTAEAAKPETKEVKPTDGAGSLAHIPIGSYYGNHLSDQ